MASIDDLDGPWWVLVEALRKGQRIERRDILAALESDFPVIDEAKPLLASIVRGEYRFSRGIKPHPRTGVIATEFFACDEVEHLAHLIKHPEDLPKDCEPGLRAELEKASAEVRSHAAARRTPHQLALAMVAKRRSISVGLLEKWRQNWRDRFRR